jgi:hypothetical protein
VRQPDDAAGRRLDVEHVTWTGDGLKFLIERSKMDAQGEGAEIAIPHGQADDTCPVTALRSWLELSKTSAGPLFRKVNRRGVAYSLPTAWKALLLRCIDRVQPSGGLELAYGRSPVYPSVTVACGTCACQTVQSANCGASEPSGL